MKKQVIVFSVMILTNTILKAQAVNEKEIIAQAVNQFANGADKRDAEMLDEILDPQFRAAVNRAFGSDKLQVIDKATYLQLIKDQKLGGDEREVTIQNITVHGTIATAEVMMEGSKLSFTTFISLIKNAEDRWLIVQDMPQIKAK